MDLMWFLVMAHLAGDYGLQSDRMAQEKRSSMRILVSHVLIYTATIGFALVIYGGVTHAYEVWRIPVIAMLAGLFVTHVAQDYLKSRYFHSRQAYYIDQILHLTALFLIRWLIYT
jgi:hypothetical protein